jgi:MFS family permease
MPNPQHAQPETQLDPRRWKALALLCTAFFMVILDSAIVVVALPSIDADLAFPAGDLQWVLSAYLLSFGGLLLLGGRAADLLGRRRMFILGTGLFALASLAAGLAGTVTALLAARVLQGVAAAIMTPTALSIVMTTFDEGAERNKALGIWGSTGAIGGTAAWLIGGPVTSGLGWEWIFFINVPVAAAVAALSPLLLRESRATVGQRRFDVAGAVTITAALVALVYAVVEAPRAGWTDGQTLGLLALAAVLILIFVGIESRSAAPLAPLGVFRSRALVGGNLVLFALGTTGFGVPFILTQYAQEVLDWSPIHFGLASVVMPVTAVIGTATAQTGRGRRHGAQRPGQPAADAGVGRRQLPRRPLLRPADPRPRHRRRLRRGLDRVADRRRRDRSRSGLGPEQRLLPDRWRGGYRDPV